MYSLKQIDDMKELVNIFLNDSNKLIIFANQSELYSQMCENKFYTKSFIIKNFYIKSDEKEIGFLCVNIKKKSEIYKDIIKYIDILIKVQDDKNIYEIVRLNEKGWKLFNLETQKKYLLSTKILKTSKIL